MFNGLVKFCNRAIYKVGDFWKKLKSLYRKLFSKWDYNIWSSVFIGIGYCIMGISLIDEKIRLAGLCSYLSFNLGVVFFLIIAPLWLRIKEKTEREIELLDEIYRVKMENATSRNGG